MVFKAMSTLLGVSLSSQLKPGDKLVLGTNGPSYIIVSKYFPGTIIGGNTSFNEVGFMALSGSQVVYISNSTIDRDPRWHIEVVTPQPPLLPTSAMFGTPVQTYPASVPYGTPFAGKISVSTKWPSNLPKPANLPNYAITLKLNIIKNGTSDIKTGISQGQNMIPGQTLSFQFSFPTGALTPNTWYMPSFWVLDTYGHNLLVQNFAPFYLSQPVQPPPPPPPPASTAKLSSRLKVGDKLMDSNTGATYVIMSKSATGFTYKWPDGRITFVSNSDIDTIGTLPWMRIIT
jgi:hypothetical protein